MDHSSAIMDFDESHPSIRPRFGQAGKPRQRILFLVRSWLRPIPSGQRHRHVLGLGRDRQSARQIPVRRLRRSSGQQTRDDKPRQAATHLDLFLAHHRGPGRALDQGGHRRHAGDGLESPVRSVVALDCRIRPEAHSVQDAGQHERCGSVRGSIGTHPSLLSPLGTRPANRVVQQDCSSVRQAVLVRQAGPGAGDAVGGSPRG